MKNSKNKIIAVLCIAICIMTVGYAAFSTVINITGTANIASTWKIVFTKIEQIDSKGTITENAIPVAEGTSATFNVGLKSPGDYVVYQITVENQGTLDAIIDDIKVSETGSDALTFEVSDVNVGDILSKGASTTLKITIGYDASITSQPSVTENKLTVSINYAQLLNQSITPSDPDIEVGDLITLSNAILRDNVAQSDAGLDFSKTSEEEGTKGLYYTSTNTEGNKPTYYFRGDVENNYVSFGNQSGCGYKGQPVLYIINPATLEVAITPTEEQCKITNVCDAGEIIKNMSGTDYRYVTGVDSATCSYLGGTPLNEKATYGNDAIDLIWRIVRINEDGSIRLITQDAVGNSAFNTNDGDNAYVGYMYGSTGQSGTNAYKLTHANDNPSTIKTVLDTWYVNNLSSYVSYLADAGFCNDRSIAPRAGLWNPNDTALGYSTNRTYYGAYYRLDYLKQPQFACPNAENDLFTTSSSTKGNKALTNPIGLLTIDEVAYAGGAYAVSNKSMYLTIGTTYWTMSPRYFNGSGASEWHVVSVGNASGSYVSYVSRGVRPVVNLQSEVEITGGDGSVLTPYIIK